MAALSTVGIIRNAVYAFKTVSPDVLSSAIDERLSVHTTSGIAVSIKGEGVLVADKRNCDCFLGCKGRTFKGNRVITGIIPSTFTHP